MLPQAVPAFVMIFLLVFARCAGIMTVLPLTYLPTMGWQWRIALAGLLAILAATAMVPASGMPATGDRAFTGELQLIVGEWVAGLLLGLSVAGLFWGLQVASQTVSQMAGLSLTAVDSEAGPVSALTRWMDLLTLSVLLASGGHRHIMRALLDTFRAAPPGQFRWSQIDPAAVFDMLGHSLQFGLRVALPLMACLLVSALLAGMLGRIMPQLNVLVMSSSLNSLLLLAILAIGAGAISWSFQGQIAAWGEQTQRLLGCETSPVSYAPPR